jgi:putative methanogen marker protein 4
MIDLQRLLTSGCRSSARVGIGLPESVYEDLRTRLTEMECRVNVFRFEDAHELVASLHGGEIDAAVRGTMRSSDVLLELKREYRIAEVMRTAVLEDASSIPFLLTPVGIDEGADFDSRLRLVQRTISYFSSAGWELRIGILSKGRLEDKYRGSEIKSSIEDGERMVELLASEGHISRHFAILIEDAVRESELVVAPDGVAGNLMFRTLHFVGGRKAYGAPVVNIPNVFVDTSRGKSDFSDAVSLAAGLFQAQAGRS